MVVVEYGPTLYLVSFCPKFNEKLLFLDDTLSHEILTKIIDLFLKNQLKMKTDAIPSLYNFRRLVASFFNRINSNDYTIQHNIHPTWEHLINWFFHHLFVLPEVSPPFLLRINNHIFLEIEYHNQFPTEILSSISKTDYPDVFDYVSKEKVPHFSKYLLNANTNEATLLMPEIPQFLSLQFYNFYNGLLGVFNILSFENEEEQQCAKFVLDYLVTIRDFFNTQDD